MKRTELKRTPFKRKRKTKRLANGDRIPADSTLDTKMSLYIRRFGRCELAGHKIECGGSLEHHHVTPRAKSKALRWNELNGLCICQNHHAWLHSNPLSGARLLDDVFGRERWDECERIKAEEPVPRGQAKIDLLKWLNDQLKNFEG